MQLWCVLKKSLKLPLFLLYRTYALALLLVLVSSPFIQAIHQNHHTQTDFSVDKKVVAFEKCDVCLYFSHINGKQLNNSDTVTLTFYPQKWVKVDCEIECSFLSSYLFNFSNKGPPFLV